MSTKIDFYNPNRFYGLVKVVESMRGRSAPMEEFKRHLADQVQELEEFSSVFRQARRAMVGENKRNSLRRNRPAGMMEAVDPFEEAVTTDTFIDVGYVITSSLQRLYDEMLSLMNDLTPGDFVLSKSRYDSMRDGKDVQNLHFEMQLNAPTLSRNIGALISLRDADIYLTKMAEDIQHSLESYHKKLIHRHTVEGLQIHRDPIITDIAMAVYSNIDADGEIQDGKNPDELSAYSLSKAKLVASFVKNSNAASLLYAPDTLIKFTTVYLGMMRSSVKSLQAGFSDATRMAMSYLDGQLARRQDVGSIDVALQAIEDLNPADVVSRDKERMMTREERFALAFQNETLEAIVDHLVDNMVSVDDLVNYVLNRKAELRKFFHEENSFYVCSISAGNPFGGEAPGALKVTPGQRPLATLDEIRGSGFDEVKDFIQSIEETNKFHNLFLATSPSKTADKANVLLVGPPGSGKSEILRAVGGDKDSIGVFAQGSDFLTCWKGEAEKNPKRLFEAGLRLSKEAKRRVHFLIDEIDSVLNDDRDFSSTNLTLEFQILMDGVVQYPNLSVWGATNFPQRIPHAMLRRFNKVVIVGELTQADRVKLLKQFVEGYLPTNIKHDAWEEAAQKLEGAVGDIIRKVGDHIWRDKLGTFVRMHPKVAEEVVTSLTEETGRFDLTEFTAEDKAKLKKRLAPHATVTSLDLSNAVDHLVGNLAIRQEIQTAVQTYESAHKLTANLNSTGQKKTSSKRPDAKKSMEFPIPDEVRAPAVMD